MLILKVTMKELKVGDVILPINHKVYDDQKVKIYRVVEICQNNTLLAEIYWYTEQTFSKIPGITEFTDTEMYITNLELKFVKKELDFNLYKRNY